MGKTFRRDTDPSSLSIPTRVSECTISYFQDDAQLCKDLDCRSPNPHLTIRSTTSAYLTTSLSLDLEVYQKTKGKINSNEQNYMYINVSESMPKLIMRLGSRMTEEALILEDHFSINVPRSHTSHSTWFLLCESGRQSPTDWSTPLIVHSRSRQVYVKGSTGMRHDRRLFFSCSPNEEIQPQLLHSTSVTLSPFPSSNGKKHCLKRKDNSETVKLYSSITDCWTAEADFWTAVDRGSTHDFHLVYSYIRFLISSSQLYFIQPNSALSFSPR